MTFSSRQAYCLEKMGIVPWVDVRKIAAATKMATATATATATESANTGSDNEATSNVSMPVERARVAKDDVQIPADISALASWLSEQPLLPFEHRGSVKSVTGSTEAPLLVVVQATDTRADKLPLSDDCVRLFDLMLRSINLSRSDVRLCVMASAAENADGNLVDDAKDPLIRNVTELAPMSVGSACADQTRAVLLMLQPWNFGDEYLSTTGQHQSRLATHQDRQMQAQTPPQTLPMWRIPHPAQLLMHSALKRSAWQVLKEIRATLHAG